MALSNITYFSNALRRNININVYLPIDDSDVIHASSDNPRPYRLLILLHGLHGSNVDWLTQTRLTSYLSGKNLVVTMPNRDNSFYVDNKNNGQLYETLVRKELVEFARKLFPVSLAYEDTYIAGLSMGGFGSLRAGLVANDTFSYIGCFSAPIIPVGYTSKDFPQEIGGVSFKGLIESNGEDLELYRLIEDTKKLPKFYITCGTKDFLYQESVKFVEYLQSHDAEVSDFYDEYDHEWAFWDISIRNFLELL